jgi:hypothetical protein
MSDTPDLSAEDFAPDDASGVSDAELRALLAEARASGNEHAGVTRGNDVATRLLNR